MAYSGASAAVAVEVASIVLAAFLVWISALAQHLTNVIHRGAGYVMGDRSLAPDMAGFFGRASRTLSNNVESALMYVPPVLAIVSLGRTGEISHYAAYLYMIARVTFTLTYWLKVPVVRSLAWLAGMICCAVMFTLAVSAVVLDP